MFRGGFAVEVVLASFLSVCGCVWLLISVCRLPAALPSKLLPRQLWHLALADIWAYSLLHLGAIYAISSSWLHTGRDDLICQVAILYRIGIITAAFVEAHLAISMLATSFRSTMLLRKLTRGLPVVWMLGITIGGASVLVTYFVDKVRMGDNRYCESGGYKGEYIKDAVLVMSVVVSFVAYMLAATMATSRTVTGAHRVRVFRRAGSFLVADLISIVPKVVTEFLHTPENTIVEVLYALGGFFNVLVYVGLHQHARLLLRRQIQQLLTNPITQYSERRPQNPFPVTFGEADVVEVPRIQREALGRASAEGRAVMAEREAMKNFLDAYGVVERPDQSLTLSMQDSTSLSENPADLAATI